MAGTHVVVSNEISKAGERSTFVTVVAWILIVLSGFGTLVSLLQNVMIQVMLHSTDMALHPATGTAPAGVAFMLDHFALLVFFILLVSAATLVASIGLLKRANWARLAVVGLMIFGIVWTLGGLALQGSTLWVVSGQAADAGAPDVFVPMMIAVGIFSALVAIGFAILFGWVAKRLLSPAIAVEFR